MAAAGVTWAPPPSLLAANLKSYATRLRNAVIKLGTYFAARMEGYAKANAPWTDRTSNARQGLVGVVISSAAEVTIVLAGLMSYSIWLEIAHGAAYAIILPTIQAHLGQIMAALRQLTGG